MERIHLFDTTKKVSLKTGLGFSFGIHAFLLSFFFLKAAFFPAQPILLGETIKVDLVALPDKVSSNPLPEVEKSAPAELAKPIEKQDTIKPIESEKPKAKPPTKTEPDTIKLEAAKQKQENAIKKLKTQAALESILKSVKDDAAKDAAKNPKSPAKKIKGNTISAGTALSGLDRLQHEDYVNQLDLKIKGNWFLPEWLTKKKMRATVRVRIDSRGAIISRQIVSSSGNSSYDESVLQTLDKSAPFPSPPEKFIDILSIDGFTVGFPD